MLLYKGALMQSGNLYHFERYQDKSVEIEKITIYEELLRILRCI